MNITTQPLRAYLFVFLTLFLMNLSSDANAQVIEDPVVQNGTPAQSSDLFNYSIGEMFDKSDALEESALASEEIAYTVSYNGSPEGKVLDNYFVTLNLDNTINSVRGNKLFDTLEGAKSAINAIEASNSNNLNSPVIEDEFRYYKYDGSNIAISFIRVIGNKYELHIHCLSSDK